MAKPALEDLLEDLLADLEEVANRFLVMAQIADAARWRLLIAAGRDERNAGWGH